MSSFMFWCIATGWVAASIAFSLWFCPRLFRYVPRDEE